MKLRELIAELTAIQARVGSETIVEVGLSHEQEGFCSKPVEVVDADTFDAVILHGGDIELAEGVTIPAELQPSPLQRGLSLLADWLEAQARAERTNTRHAEARAEKCLERLFKLDPAALRAGLRAQKVADQDLREAARTLHTYSRRYCDGRSTYAPADHNRATHTLLRLGVTLDTDPISTTGPFAADGMYGLEPADLAALAQAGAGGGA